MARSSHHMYTEYVSNSFSFSQYIECAVWSSPRGARNGKVVLYTLAFYCVRMNGRYTMRPCIFKCGKAFCGKPI